MKLWSCRNQKEKKKAEGSDYLLGKLNESNKNFRTRMAYLRSVQVRETGLCMIIILF